MRYLFLGLKLAVFIVLLLLAMQNSQAYYLAGTRTTLGNAIAFQGATGADRSATGTDAPKLDALQRRGRSRASRA